MKRLKCDTCIRKASQLKFCTDLCRELWTNKENRVSNVNEAVANAAVKAGICRDSENLTEAALITLANDLAEVILEQKREIYKLQQQLINTLAPNGN